MLQSMPARYVNQWMSPGVEVRAGSLFAVRTLHKSALVPVLVPSSAVKGACDDVISNFAVSTISISHAGDGKIPSLDV